MANKLLIRLYNVGLGDCIYVRIPGNNPTDKDFHMLIDCGTLSEEVLARNAVQHLEEQMLPAVGDTGKKRLDLLVATHPHTDHIIGFDPEVFKNIQIGQIWMSPIMDPQHPQAQSSHQLRAFATQAVQGVVKKGLTLGPEFSLLAQQYGLQRAGAEEALRKKIPQHNGIQPRYVHAGQTSGELGLALPQAKITVLNPENNIDYYYLGKEEAAGFQGLTDFAQVFAEKAVEKKPQKPRNISVRDFEVLQSRMLSDAFAFANLNNQVENNASVVLLLEWRNKRLLFVGDAEWNKGFKAGKRNGAWNVMWNKRKELLNQPIDFLKIGHHGSVNATPWLASEPAGHEVNQILNAILPLPANGASPQAQAVVSTKRGNYAVIPDAQLLVELGKRVKDQRQYRTAFAQLPNFDFQSIPLYDREKANLNKKQPFRTDFESLLQKGDFIDIELPA